MTECRVRSRASSTPASAIRGPPAPKNTGGKGSERMPFDSCSARTSSAPRRSPLVSPAISMKERGFIPGAGDQRFRCCRFRLMPGVAPSPAPNLAGDFKGHIQCALGRLAADPRRLAVAHRLDEMLQFKFERFLLPDGNRLAHDPFAAELAYDGRVPGLKQLFEQRRFL